MHLTIHGKNIDVTPALRDYAEEKIGKIEKYLHAITSAHLFLVVEKYRHSAEVTIQAHGITLKAKEETGDMYSSIDKIVDKIEIQARKLKDKIQDKNKSAPAEGETAPEPPVHPTAAPRIVHSNSFDPRPKTVDEALLALQERGDMFMVYVDARTQKICVLYRRGQENEFGLIETAAR